MEKLSHSMKIFGHLLELFDNRITIKILGKFDNGKSLKTEGDSLSEVGIYQNSHQFVVFFVQT